MEVGLTVQTQNASVVTSGLQAAGKGRQVKPETTIVQAERKAVGPGIMGGGDFLARVAEAVETTNVKIDSVPNNRVRFRVLEDSATCIVQVVDKETEEIIRQIPPEEMLAVKENLATTFRGVLLDSAG